LFNVCSAIIFLPITHHYVRFLEFIIKEKKQPEEDQTENPAVVLDKLLLDTPVAAIRASKESMMFGVRIARHMLNTAMNMICDFDFSKTASIEQSEDELNILQKELTRYVVELSKRHMTGSSSAMIPAIITCMNHIERIGDHSKDLKNLANIRHERELQFSEAAIKDLRALEKQILEMMNLLVRELSLQEGKDPNAVRLLNQIHEMENEIDIQSARYINDHIHRLEDGKCTVESGVIFIDMVNYMERISDHVYKACRDLSAGEPEARLNVSVQ
jgi:phosphate:Na+ symporter